MIDTLWSDVKTAYEPYLALYRFIMLDADVMDYHILMDTGYVFPACFKIHHEHIEIDVYCYNFSSMDQARDALISWMFDMPKTWKCSTVSDNIQDSEFDAETRKSDVNSQFGLDKDGI